MWGDYDKIICYFISWRHRSSDKGHTVWCNAWLCPEWMRMRFAYHLWYARMFQRCSNIRWAFEKLSLMTIELLMFDSSGSQKSSMHSYSHEKRTQQHYLISSFRDLAPHRSSAAITSGARSMLSIWQYVKVQGWNSRYPMLWTHMMQVLLLWMQ